MFLLDTNICIYALNKRPPSVLEKLRQVGPAKMKLSVVTVFELRVGTEKSQSRGATQSKLDFFLNPFEILPFDEEDANVGAKIRARLERSGTRIGDLDGLIAAQALRHNLVLVSNNLREFARIPGLRYENWALLP